jgi:hypothetical protein
MRAKIAWLRIRAKSWEAGYSEKCPSLAFGEASNALAVVELPTDAEPPPTGSGSGVRAGLLVKARKDMSSVPAGTGMTDVFYLFSRSKFKKDGFR